jgi:hypothetical protein
MIDHLLAIKKAVATASAAGLIALPPADQDRLQRVFPGNPTAPRVASTGRR